jgi:hypothetical protein
MNEFQPTTASMISDERHQNQAYTIPDTLANTIPETTPNAFSLPEIPTTQDVPPLPALRLPQVNPSHVVATRQRSHPSLIPVSSSQVATDPIPSVRQEDEQQKLSFVTSSSNEAYYRNVSKYTGITYIPKSMTRHKQPTIADALIACATLLLLCLCFLLLLTYLGL